MRHVEQCSRGIPLNTHISRLGQPRQGTQRTRTSDLSLVLLVCRQVGDAANSIALYLHIRRHHLPDKRCQASELDNQDLVLGCSITLAQPSHQHPTPWKVSLLLTARLPKAALAALCTSISGLWRRNRIGSRVSRSTSRTSTKQVLAPYSLPVYAASVSAVGSSVSHSHRHAETVAAHSRPSGDLSTGVETYRARLFPRMSSLRFAGGRYCRSTPVCLGLGAARQRRSRFRRAVGGESQQLIHQPYI